MSVTYSKAIQQKLIIITQCVYVLWGRGKRKVASVSSWWIDERYAGVHWTEFAKKKFMFMARRWAFFFFFNFKSSQQRTFYSVFPAEGDRGHTLILHSLRGRALIDSLMTGMFHLNPSQGVSLWGFLFLGEDGKACSFCLLCRWRRKLRGTLQCTVVLSSAKAPLRMSECFWLCGWRSGSAIQLTCS